MAYGLNAEEFLIKDGHLEIGSWTTPNNVGVVGSPYSYWTSAGIVGYHKMGTIKVGIARTYAAPLVGTPSFEIRRDIITKMITIELALFQQNSDLWLLRDGFFTQAGFVSGGFTGDLAHMGFDEPASAKTAQGFLLRSKLVDNTPYDIGIYYARSVNEDNSETRSGTEHVSIPLKLQAFPHPAFNPFDDTDATKCFGVKIIDNS